MKQRKENPRMERGGGWRVICKYYKLRYVCWSAGERLHSSPVECMVLGREMVCECEKCKRKMYEEDGNRWREEEETEE